jgi:hypothetical protein
MLQSDQIQANQTNPLFAVLSVNINARAQRRGDAKRKSGVRSSGAFISMDGSLHEFNSFAPLGLGVSALIALVSEIPDKIVKLCREVSEVIFASLRIITHEKFHSPNPAGKNEKQNRCAGWLLIPIKPSPTKSNHFAVLRASIAVNV